MDKNYIKIKIMTVAAFRAQGYLQELNRQFLHPLGISLETTIRNGREVFDSIWDYREDDEGIVVSGQAMKGRSAIRMCERGNFVMQSQAEKMVLRKKLLKYHIQPLPVIERDKERTKLRNRKEKKS